MYACVCVRVNPMSVCVCVCLVGWPPSPLLINVKLGLEPQCQLAHIVRDTSLVRVLVVVTVVTVAHAAAGRAAVEPRRTPAQIATVRGRRGATDQVAPLVLPLALLHAGQIEQIVPQGRRGYRRRRYRTGRRRGRRPRRDATADG